MKNRILSAILFLAVVVPPTTRAASSGVAEFVSATTSQSAFIAAPADATVYQLLAGQRIDAGTVTVFTTAEGRLVVTYRTTGPWKIIETHLEFGLRVQDFPRSGNGSPIPGQFDYGGPQAPGTTAVQYVFNLGSDVPPGATLLVGAHAVVTGQGTETAWSAGTRFGKNWFTYSTYVRPARGRELSVAKAFETDLQWLGYPGEFTITVTNNGPDAAGAIVVSDALDPLFESLEARVENGNGICSIQGDSAPFVLSCTLNSLLVGESAVVRVEYMTTYVRGASGTLTNCASAKDSDGNSAQGCASVPYVPGPV